MAEWVRSHAAMVNKLISVSQKECHLSIRDRPKLEKNWRGLGLRITKTREEKKIDNLWLSIS